MKRYAVTLVVALAVLLAATGAATAQTAEAPTQNDGSPIELPEPVPEFVTDLLEAIGAFVADVIDALDEAIRSIVPAAGGSPGGR